MDERSADHLSKKPFGRRAVERGFATEGAVLQALRAQYNAKVTLGRHLFLGEVMLLQGTLTARQLAELLRDSGDRLEEAEDVVERRFFGDIAIEMGFITPNQVLAALNQQREEDARGERHRLVGEILFATGAISKAQVEDVIAEMVQRPARGKAGEKPQ